MSTKTSIKRIALVAVAALGFGLLSVVPSNAADLGSVSIVSGDFTGTTGTPVTANILHSNVTADDAESAVGAAFYGAPATSSVTSKYALLWTVSDTTTATNVKVGTGVSTYINPELNEAPGAGNAYLAQRFPADWNKYTKTLLWNSNTANARASLYTKLTFTPDKAGTYTVRVFAMPKNTTDAAFVDWVVVVADPAPLATKTTAYASSVDRTSASYFTEALDESATLTAGKAAGNLAGVFYVVQSNGSTTNPLVAGGKLTVTMSGSGLAHVVNLADSCAATSAVRAMTGTSTNLGQKVCLYSDGTSGTGTVTWAVGSTVLGSGSASFYGAPAKYTAVVNNSVISTDAAVATTATTVSNSNRRSVSVFVTDSNGIPVANADVYMNSSDTTVISGSYVKATTADDGLGRVRYDLTGVAAGTATLSFTNKRFANDPLITASNPEITAGPVTVRVGSTAPDKVTVSFDKAEYAPGEIAVVTVTVTDKAGLPVPRGKYQVFNSALSASRAFASGTIPGTANANASCADAAGIPGTAAVTCATTGGYAGLGYYMGTPVIEAGSVWISGSTGTATFTMNMPLAPGEVKLSGTTYTLLPNGLGTSANAATAVSATANVVADNSVAQAAADAAAEATDAANAATDAANAAAEAADAATAAAQDAADAVAALSTQVSEMVNALKKQITALTNLVIKIQKKVRA